MKINLIVLAAGNSKRFNGNKLLTLLEGKPIFMHVVERVLPLSFHKILLVTQYEEVKEIVKEKNIDVIINNEPNNGISSSIKLGLENCNNCDGIMFMVCDQPRITMETIEGIINEFVASDKGIIVASSNGEMGNPTLFDVSYSKELLSLQGDKGGKQVIMRHLDDVGFYEVDKEELIDIDRREDLKFFL